MNQTELLDQFILEARECLEQVGERLLQVEKAPEDPDLLNDLFRLVHTLKGNCGLFEFKPLERVVHAGEDLLDRIRNGQLGYSNDIADALLEAMDFTAQMVDEIEQSGAIGASAEGRSQALSASLRAHLGGAAPKRAASAGTSPSSPAEAQPDPRSQAPSPSSAVSAVGSAAAPLPAPPAWAARVPGELLAAHPQGTLWRYEPEPECFFKGEDPWLLAKQAPALLHIDVGVQSPWPELAEADCYRSNLSLVGFSDAPLAYVEEHFRCVAEQLECVSAAQVMDAGASRTAHATQPTQADSTQAAAPDDTAQAGAELARHAARTLQRRGLQIWDDQLSLLARPQLAAGTLAAVHTTLDHLLRLLDPAQAERPDPALGAAALAQWAQRHRPAPAEAAAGPEAADTREGAEAAGSMDAAGAGLPPAGAEASRRSGGDDPSHQKVLKVGQEKIDRLMDLIGEMVVAKNALPYLAHRAETHFQQRELAREIKAQYAVINRIAEDMQHAIMQVRMMPVGTIFQRFGRLVRDTSRKLGKDVNLVIEGEETEADKNVIESLADPLIHIIRNSLDHGIELPEQRQKAGKPAQGTIRVAARQESDRVIIEIDDDGAGVDPQRVRRKAIERGLIPEDKAQTLSDADAVQLVFLPGFSTADAISDLSGRGVGMDVVRTAVERINGQVQLSSDFGRGTRLRLSLPLSMAVTNVMIIEAAGRRFGVPMDLIVETVRMHTEDIHHFKQAQTAVLRGRIVPLRALHDLLALDEPPRVNEEGEHAVLVVRFGHENVGLLVDQFHGATDIILKPLEGVLAGLTGFAGTALMGDGSVLMVLNPKELV